MKEFIAIFKNNFYRSLTRKNMIIMTLAMISASILLAIVFTSKVNGRISIAVISRTDISIANANLKVTRLSKRPPLSELVKGRYAAAVGYSTKGGYSIYTLKDDTFKNALKLMLLHPGEKLGNYGEKRRVGSNIIGYMIIFVLLQGIMLMMLYSDDKEQKLTGRIRLSPVSSTIYILSHSAFNLILTYIPVMLIIIVCKGLLKFNMGFSYFNYMVLVGLLSLLATSFGIFICSLVDGADNAMMLGSSILTLSSVLAGSFYSFDNGNRIMKSIIGLLPQKNLLQIVVGIENGGAYLKYIPQLSYIGSLVLILFIASIVISKRKAQ